MAEVALRLRSVWKRFGSTLAVRDLTLDVRRGEFVSLLGPSGCGKTTTLRLVAGYLRPDAGAIELEGQDVTRTPPYRRDIGMVFQNYALFPHLTVWENVAFGLRMRRVPGAELRRRVGEALALVRLEGLGQRKPRELSGGQQQRVALARAVVIRPRLLLFDEPLSNLDAKLRKSMQIELRKLQEQLGITTVHVTHDQEEALSLSDRVAILNEGRLEQQGGPVEVYLHPRSLFVADFVGKSNLLRARVGEGDGGRGLTWVALDSGERLLVRAKPETAELAPGSAAWLVARPEAVRLLRAQPGAPLDNAFRGVVRRTVYTGAVTTALVALDSGLELMAEEQNLDPGRPGLAPGDRVVVSLSPEALFLVQD
jgi:spermidine/putrescine transport system ATP-binding protein